MPPHRLPAFLTAALAGLFLCAGGAHAAPLELPPLSDPPGRTHLPGKVIWADLVTPDLAAAEAFYSGLFGWTFRDTHSGDTNYAVALVNGRPIAGIVQRPIPAGEQHQPHWLTFVAVADVDRAARLAVKDGAKELAKPTTYNGRGRQAVLSGPDGAVFAILASASGDPGDYLAEPGEWIWSALLTSDPDTAAKFYQSVFGYDLFDLPSTDGLEHVVLSSQDYARAGINSLPKDARHRHAHWLNFVRVADTDAAVARAVTLGGRVLVEPRVDRNGGKIALLADPAGAPFGIMEWTSSDTQTEPK
jgi:predicted enzyme related to lactoylglutathione lyase